MQDILLTALLSIVTSAITAYVAAKLGMRAERRKWEDQLALELSKLRIENPRGASRLAQDFAVAFLVLTQPGEERQKIFVPPNGSLLVGRGDDADIVVKDQNVSRHHMRIGCRDGAVWISDLQSTAGAKLNGEWIAGPTKLKDGDEITLGKVSLFFNELRKA